jgi:6-phosphogluconolactonase
VVRWPWGDGAAAFPFSPEWPLVLLDSGGGLNSRAVRLRCPDRQAGVAPDDLDTPRPVSRSNFCSEILFSPDGRFLYAGNRLHDSIAVFTVGADGALKYVGGEWTRGNYPRSFNFDPTGQFLYCCNQRSDNIAVFRMDATTGRPNFTGHYAAVGNPSAIVFLDLGRKR